MTLIKHYRTPPRVAAPAVTFIYATVNIAAPLGLSTQTRHAGWDGRPGIANLLGMPVLIAGVAMILWAATAHARALATTRLAGAEARNTCSHPSTW